MVREVQNGRAVPRSSTCASTSTRARCRTWREDLTRRIESGDIVLKDWHHDIAFRSWDCHPVGDLLRPAPAAERVGDGRRHVDARRLRLADRSADAELDPAGRRWYVFTEGPVWSVAEQALYYSDIPDDRRFRWTESAAHGARRVPDVQGQRHGLRRRGPADRVRARVELDHPLPRRRVPRDRVLPPRRRVPQQPQRPREPQAATAASTSPIPTTGGGTTGSAASACRCSDTRRCSACRTRAARPSSSSSRDEFEQPNGLCFSPDESLMYVNDSPRAEIKVFDVADDGMLVNGRVLADGHRRWHDRGAAPSTAWSATSSATCGSPDRVACGCSTPTGRADRHDPDPGGVRKPVLGRPRPAHAVPDDVDDGAHDPDAVHLGAPPHYDIGARQR